MATGNSAPLLQSLADDFRVRRHRLQQMVAQL
jgi:hypothetical protein